MNHKPCYGTMLPETLAVPRDGPAAGKAFSLVIAHAGGLFMSDRRVGVDVAAWDDCRSCEEFEHCHKLCVSRLLLEAAVARA